MKKWLIYFMSIGLAIAMVSPAFAQEAVKKEFTLEEIVVTAERRESNAQDTPVSLTAFSAADVDDLSIATNIDLQTRMPSTTFTGNKIYIRGVGRDMNQVLIDPGVAVYWDGMYNNEQAAIDYTFGVERIEAMRGPQDTLYGKSTIGGAINVITKKPTKEFSGQVVAKIGTYEQRDFHGMVSGPLYKDKLMGTVLLTHLYYGGHTKNVWNNEYSGAGKTWNAAFRLLFEPTDRLQIYGQYVAREYYYSEGTGYMHGSTRSPDPWKTTGVLYTSPSTVIHNTAYNRDPNQVNPGVDSPWHFYCTPGFRPRKTDNDVKAGQISTTFELTDAWTIKWNQFSDGWHWDWMFDSSSDTDYQYNTDIPMWANSWQEELQVSYASPESKITFLGGLYYFYLHENQQVFIAYKGNNTISTPVDGSAWRELGGTPTTWPSGETVIYPPDYVPYLRFGYPISFMYDVWGETVSQAVYGQFDYQITDELNLTVGLRVLKDLRKGHETQLYLTQDTAFGPFNQVLLDQGGYNTGPWPYRNGIPFYYPDKQHHKQDWQEFVGKVGADYKPSEDTLFFAKLSKGYKAGGFPLGSFQEEAFDPEYLWSYEAGWKQLWMDSRFNTNLAVYYYDYTDFQVVLSEEDPISLRRSSKVRNADGATNWGIELEAKGYVIDNLLVEFMYSFMSTEYKAFSQIDTNYPDKGIQDLEGKELNRSPKHKFAVSGTYTIPTDIGDFVLYANYYWQDEAYFRPFNLPIDKSKAWAKTDARIMYFTPDHKWRIALEFSNIFDQPGIQDVSVGGQAWTDEDTGEYHDYVSRSYYIIAPFQASLEVSYTW